MLPILRVCTVVVVQVKCFGQRAESNLHEGVSDFYLKKQIDTIGFICTGSLMSVYHTCGNSKCACAHDESARHGPYNRWTRKVKGKTVTRTLTDKQTELCRECINNYRNLESIIKEMKELSVQYIEEQK